MTNTTKATNFACYQIKRNGLSIYMSCLYCIFLQKIFIYLYKEYNYDEHVLYFILSCAEYNLILKKCTPTLSFLRKLAYLTEGSFFIKLSIIAILIRWGDLSRGNIALVVLAHVYVYAVGQKVSLFDVDWSVTKYIQDQPLPLSPFIKTPRGMKGARGKGRRTTTYVSEKRPI